MLTNSPVHECEAGRSRRREYKAAPAGEGSLPTGRCARTSGDREELRDRDRAGRPRRRQAAQNGPHRLRLEAPCLRQRRPHPWHRMAEKRSPELPNLMVAEAATEDNMATAL